MTVFPERTARQQVLWLFGHAFPLMLVGVVQTAAAWDWLSDPRWCWRADYALAGVGGIVAAGAGAAIAVLCVRRMVIPFAAQEMRLDMKGALAIEVTVLFLCSFILDLGLMQSMIFRLFLAANLALITLAAPRATEQPALCSPLDSPAP